MEKRRAHTFVSSLIAYMHIRFSISPRYLKNAIEKNASDLRNLQSLDLAAIVVL